jgi:iron complex transport system permease protein
MSPATLWEDEMARNLVLNLRLPRVLTAILLGMALAACGSVLQMIFRNPLVEPGLLGVSQGAAFGAALSIIFLGGSALLMEGVATFFACLGLAVSYLLVGHRGVGALCLRGGVAQVSGRSPDPTARDRLLDVGRAVGRHVE